MTVITKRARHWWRNFEKTHEVELRLAGRRYMGKAEAKTGEEDALQFMVDSVQKRPIQAKAYGLARDEITREKVAGILPHIVLIRIAISTVE